MISTAGFDSKTGADNTAHLVCAAASGCVPAVYSGLCSGYGSVTFHCRLTANPVAIAFCAGLVFLWSLANHRHTHQGHCP